jgi:hypothetical protein
MTSLFAGGELPLDKATLFARVVSELQPLDLPAAFAMERWSYLPAVLAGLAILWAWRRDARPRERFLAVAAAGYGLAALLFVRFEYVAAPFTLALLAVSCGHALGAVLPAQWGRAAAVTGLLAATLPAVVLHARLDGHITDPPSRQELGRRAAYAWLAEHVPVGDRLAAGWSIGYELRAADILRPGHAHGRISRERREPGTPAGVLPGPVQRG